MKKIFTLVAAFAAVLTASAQSAYIIQDGDAIEGGQAITSIDGIKLTYGNDTWSVSASSLTVAETEFVAYASTGNSPKFETDEEGKAINAFPISGAYVTFDATKAGSVTAILQNTTGNKPVVLIDADGNGVAGTPVASNKNNPSNPNWESGQQLPEGTESSDKFNGGLKFDVQPGGKYYLYIKGSKMRFMGFIFEENPDAINTVAATAAKSDVRYNLAGQRVNAGAKGIVVENGKKLFVK